MYCTRCGSQIADNSTFCPQCGAPQGAAMPAGNGAQQGYGQAPQQYSQQQYGYAQNAQQGYGQQAQPYGYAQPQAQAQAADKPKPGIKPAVIIIVVVVVIALLAVLVFAVGSCSRNASSTASDAPGAESTDSGQESGVDGSQISPEYAAYAEQLQKLIDLSGEGQIGTSGDVSYIDGVAFAALDDVDGDGVDEMIVVIGSDDLSDSDYGQALLFDYTEYGVNQGALGLYITVAEDYTGDVSVENVLAALFSYATAESQSYFIEGNVSYATLSYSTSYSQYLHVKGFDWANLQDFYSYGTSDGDSVKESYQVDGIDVDEDTFDSAWQAWDETPYWAIVADNADDLESTLDCLAQVEETLGLQASADAGQEA